MVVVNLTRSRAETLGNVALGLRLSRARRVGWWSPAPRATASTASRAHVAGALPVAGAFVKAHGRVFWLDRPEHLPDACRGLGRARRRRR